jgi:hypothetical protein
MREVKVRLTSEYPTVAVTAGAAAIPVLEAGAVRDLAPDLQVRLTAGGGYFAPAALKVTLTYDGWHTEEQNIPILIVPEIVEAPDAFEVLDGRTVTFQVFRQKGNQGGGSSVSRTVTEGRGNGNGVLEPGEEATVWVRMRQGMDPFDKGNWYRTKVHSSGDALVEVADIEEQKQLEWTGAKERTSLIRRGPGPPDGFVLLENETWSYHFTPDVRYGAQPLYQAFQMHTRHLHRLPLSALTEPRVRSTQAGGQR